MIVKAAAFLSLIVTVTAAPPGPAAAIAQAPAAAPVIDFGVPEQQPGPLTATSQDPQGIPFQNKLLNASNGTFWIGKPTSCDLPDKKACPEKKETMVQLWSTGVLTLTEPAPGGQQVFIDRTGVLSYTSAHINANNIPQNSTTRGFYAAKAPSEGSPQLYNRLSEGGYWLGCPVNKEGIRSGPWKVFKDRIIMAKGGSTHNLVQDASVPTKRKADCFVFRLVYYAGLSYDVAAAWQ
ncbi:hypothetical protein H072_9773 [Dactylellina haptotyla CBS 200.50]|uniref:Secreted protein n=1 Tax=Dactylellina haptotyla (strain CBS 200.50) TaxID=1284197 RepID=S8BBV8_DACHA|nr:hypothetical protein H072_9773 [Dactylellina haptotyla CBS 200.50]